MGAGRWIVGAAVRASQVHDGLGFAHELGSRAVGGARGAGSGTAGIYRVGLEQRHRRSGTRIGADGGMFHSDADRGQALSALDVGFARFRADAEPIATAIGSPPARAQWWTADVLPLLSDWATFRQHESSWSARIATEWSTYQAWHQVLRGMRSGARAQGIALASPEPPPLPRTMFERAGAGQGTKMEAAWTIGRTLVYTAIGLAGVAGIYAAWKEFRASPGKAPEA